MSKTEDFLTKEEEQEIVEKRAIHDLAAERVGQDQHEGFQRASVVQQECVGWMRF